MKNIKNFSNLDEDSNLKIIKFNRNYNSNRFFYIYLIIFFLFQICTFIIIIYSIKLVNDTKLLLIKQSLITSKERELFINETNKLVTENKKLFNDRMIFNNLNYKNELNIYRLLCPKEVVGKKKQLFGIHGDGGYVLLDDLNDIKIAYSIGISNIISFDKDLANKGIDVFMYDHTIENLPFNHEKFHWKKIGLTSESKKNQNMKTLYEV